MTTATIPLDETARTAAEALQEAHDRKMWEKAVAVGDAWIDARGEMPALCAVWYSQALQAVGRYADGYRWGQVAAHAIPDSHGVAKVAALSTFAAACSRSGRFGEARRQLKAMLALRVDHPEAIEKQGHVLLATSDKWRDGWAKQEARLTDERHQAPEFPHWWDGTSKGRIAVLHEQGLGDAILSARWLPWAATRSGHLVTWYGPEDALGRWIGALPGVVVGDRTKHNPSAIDFACWSMSLPHLAGCGRPRHVPAPQAPAGLLAERRYRRTGSPLRVGVCWKGSSGGWHDFERSFTPAHFAPVWKPLPGVEFVNLTHGAEAPADAPFGPAFFTDVYDTGETLVTLDLVVSVDTSVVHLAGSLGIPTLAIVPTVPDWRYGWPHNGRSPFYASVTVLRRMRGDDLTVITKARTLVEHYARELRKMGA